MGGIFLDEYHKLFNNSALDKVVQVVSYVGGARHAIFFAVPMLLLGSLIASKEIILFRQRKLYLSICVFLFALGFVEATLLKNIIGIEVTADVTIFGWTPAIPLFLFGISTKSKISVEWLRKLRKIADVVYIIHVWIIEVCKRIIGVNLFSQLILVLIFSFSIAVVVVMTFDKNA